MLTTHHGEYCERQPQHEWNPGQRSGSMTPSLPGDASWGSPHGARCVNKQTFVAAENQKVLLATGAIQ